MKIPFKFFSPLFQRDPFRFPLYISLNSAIKEHIGRESIVFTVSYTIEIKRRKVNEM